MCFRCELFNGPVTIHEAVVEALGEQVRTRREIVAEVMARTGAAPGSISAHMNMLVGRRVLVRPARGVYRLNPELFE